VISLDRKDRYDWLREIEQLDPETEYVEIYRIMSGHEFPWDMNQSLSFALFRTYAVPSIGRLLARTGEFTQRVQKRYDDTGLILEAVLEHGFGHETGRAAIGRMNQMHRSYPIRQDDLRYVLCTFVVVPMRWMDDYGWRPFTEREKVASANYYRELGRHMGISGIPATYQEFTEHLDRYEAEHFGYDDGSRAVADSTLELLTTFPPNHLAPRAVVKTFSYALMDAPLRDALHYPTPPGPVEIASRAALKLRGRIVRYMKPRAEPKMVRDLPNIRSYPNGFEVSRLGTFPIGSPVPHAARPSSPSGAAASN
jgi:hypothetical protein